MSDSSWRKFGAGFVVFVLAVWAWLSGVAEPRVKRSVAVIPSATSSVRPTSAPVEPPRSAPTRERGAVARADFGRDWPFTVDEGEVWCMNGGGQPVVMFTAGDRRYALNGNARELVDGQAIRDFSEIKAPGGSVRPLIARGIALCPKP